MTVALVAALVVGSAAVSFAQSAPFVHTVELSSTSLGGGSQLTLATPSTLITGDILIVQIAVRGGTSDDIVAPDGWTLVRRDNAAKSIAQAVFGRAIADPAAEPVSYTFTFNSGNDAIGALVDFGGVTTLDSVVASAGEGNAKSNIVTAPSATSPSVPANYLAVELFSTAYGVPVNPRPI